MKNIYLILFLVINSNTYSQDLLKPVDDNDIDGLIERLSSDSFGIIYNNFATQIKLGYYAQKIEEYGKDASPKLIEILESNARY